LKQVLRVKEVAEYLRMCPMTVYRMAKQGEIPCFKVGDEWRFKFDSINSWIIEKEKLNEKRSEIGGA
jgi:excisionase family DNA binding protein